MTERIALDNVEEKKLFLVNNNADLSLSRENELPMAFVIDAVERSHTLIRRFTEFDVDVFALLGMRNLSAFVGEVFAAQMVIAG